jgi:hypothetical protein
LHFDMDREVTKEECVLHPLIHTLLDFTLAQDIEKKKAEPRTPHFLSLNQNIVGGPQMQKCGLKYVIHSPGDHCGLQIKRSKKTPTRLLQWASCPGSISYLSSSALAGMRTVPLKVALTIPPPPRTLSFNPSRSPPMPCPFLLAIRDT